MSEQWRDSQHQAGSAYHAAPQRRPAADGDRQGNVVYRAAGAGHTQPGHARPGAAPRPQAARRPASPAAPRQAPRRPAPAPTSGQRRPAAAPPPQQPPRRPLPPAELQARREAARRRRELRRRRRRMLLLGVVLGILALSGVITLLLPAQPASAPSGPEAGSTPAAGNGQLVAPLPYNGNTVQAAPTADWGSVGPVRQADARTYTAAPEAPAALPECGQVTTDYFSDAAFVGDSLTEGFIDYKISLSGALVCGYKGASPDTIFKRKTVTHSERGEEVALDVLAQRQPRKVYVLMGTNILGGTSDDDWFINQYASMLDAIRETLPAATIYVQAVLPVRPEALESVPGLSRDRVRSINASLQALSAEKGCYFLDLYGEFADEDGDLTADYAEQDGVHLKASGYRKWVKFLQTHVPYSKQNPYQPGSAWYLDESLRGLLNDIP